MKKPKISVLMPVYNAEKFLKEAIDSILSQTFKDFEFLIINDASTDNSKEIILSYKDPRIRYYENKKNLGVAKTLNRGLRLAKGKYIARMDADDITNPQRLEIEYNEIMKDDMVAVVASYYDVIDKNGKYLYTIKDASSAEDIYYFLQFRDCLGHPTVMYKKEIILNEFHGYKSCEAEDYELWLRVSKKYRIIKIRNILHKLRKSDCSRVGKSKRKIIENAVQVALYNASFLNKHTSKYSVAKFLFSLNITSKLTFKTKVILMLLKEINNDILKKVPVFLKKEKIIKCILKKEMSVRFQLLALHILNSLKKSI